MPQNEERAGIGAAVEARQIAVLNVLRSSADQQRSRRAEDLLDRPPFTAVNAGHPLHFVVGAGDEAIQTHHRVPQHLAHLVHPFLVCAVLGRMKRLGVSPRPLDIRLGDDWRAQRGQGRRSTYARRARDGRIGRASPEEQITAGGAVAIDDESKSSKVQEAVRSFVSSCDLRIHRPVRVKVRCVTPLGEGVASIS